MNVQLVTRALALLGQKVTARKMEPMTIVLAGGSAGLLGGLLPATRVTSDCDVMRFWFGSGVDVAGGWDQIERAAVEVAEELQLTESWFNRKCQNFAGNLALGWLDRCETVEVFGVLTVMRISRVDLLASKIISAPTRPQDLKDIVSIAPTAEELDVLELHIDRVESEDLDHASFEKQRRIIQSLRGVK